MCFIGVDSHTHKTHTCLCEGIVSWLMERTSSMPLDPWIIIRLWAVSIHVVNVDLPKMPLNFMLSSMISTMENIYWTTQKILCVHMHCATLHNCIPIVQSTYIVLNNFGSIVRPFFMALLIHYLYLLLLESDGSWRGLRTLVICTRIATYKLHQCSSFISLWPLKL